MHIGLFDSQWRGHHAVYGSLTAQSLLDAGHEVTFFTASNHARLDVFPDHPDFEIVELAPLNVNDDDGGYLGTLEDQWIRFRHFRRGMTVARSEGVDVVHFLLLDWFRLPIRAGTALDSSHPPIVATLHRDYWATPNQLPAETLAQRGKRGIKRTLDRGNRWSLASCLGDNSIERVLVHAPSMRERLESSMNFPENAVQTVPAPTPEPEEDLFPEDARRRLDLPSEGPISLFFGALGYEKGPDVLGKALQSIEREVTVVFAGSEGTFGADDIEQWRSQSRPNVDVQDRLEYVPEPDVYPYLVAADVLVLPYRRRYGISGPLRRAALVGTPAIASEGTDVGTIVADNELGTTFEYGDPEALARTIDSAVASDPGRFASGVDAYRQRNDLSSVRQALEAVYEAVASSRDGVETV